MTAPAIVTREHLERAYAQTRKPGWPSLDVLRECYLHYAVVTGRARAIAEGQVLPPEPVVAAPAAPAAPMQTPAHPPRRRREDGPPAIDHKLAASGEYARHDIE